MGSLLAPTLVLILIAIHETGHAIAGLTDAPKSRARFFGVVGPTRERGKKGDSLSRTIPEVSHP